MLAVFEGFAVIAGVILVGFILGRSGVLGPHGQQVIAKLVFYAGTPTLLYVTVAETDLGLIFNTALFATGGSALIVGAALFDLVKEINTLSASASKEALEAAAAVFDELAGVLGLLYNRKKDEVPPAILELVEKRAAAKKAKDWAAADALRAEIAAQGWAVKDTAQGPQLSRI